MKEEVFSRSAILNGFLGCLGQRLSTSLGGNKKAAPPKESGGMINLHFSFTASLRWYYPGQVMRVIQMVLDSQPEAPLARLPWMLHLSIFRCQLKFVGGGQHYRLLKHAGSDDNAEVAGLSGREAPMRKSFFGF